MDPESVIQSEVSQTKKNKYCILTHVCRVSKNGTDEPICRAGIELLTWGTDMGGRGEWYQLGDQDWLISTTMCKILIVSENLLYNTGSSAGCSVMT